MLNMTLVIQMINFWIAYVILTRLLLKPAITLVQSEDQRVMNLQTTVQELTEAVARKTLEHEQEWHSMRERLQQKKPSEVLSKIVMTQPRIEEIIEPVDENEIQILSAQLKNFIVHRIVHDQRH